MSSTPPRRPHSNPNSGEPSSSASQFTTPSRTGSLPNQSSSVPSKLNLGSLSTHVSGGGTHSNIRISSRSPSPVPSNTGGPGELPSYASYPPGQGGMNGLGIHGLHGGQHQTTNGGIPSPNADRSGGSAVVSMKDGNGYPRGINEGDEKEEDSMLGQGSRSGQPQGGPGSQQGGSGQGGDEPSSRGMVAFSVIFYLVAALVMVFANKWVLNAIPVPLFILFCQLVMAVILLHIANFFGYFPIPTFRLSVCKGLMPLVTINVIGLIFNTYCLQYVDASFYQVARGLVLPFTVFFSYILLGAKSSSAILVSVGIVCMGFLLGVSTDHLTVSPIGVSFGVFSSLTTSVHAIVVKRSLPVVRGSAMDLAYYNNLLSALLVTPIMLLAGEGPFIWELIGLGGVTVTGGENDMVKEGQDTQVKATMASVDSGKGLPEGAMGTFWMGAVITGVFGFLICIAGFISIKTTSPTTHMISSAVRGVLQTFLGKWFFGDIVTSGRASGIGFILAGSIFYTYIKDRETRQRSAQAATTNSSSSSPPNPSRLNPSASASSRRDPGAPVSPIGGTVHGRKASTPGWTTVGMSSVGGGNGEGSSRDEITPMDNEKARMRVY